GRARRAFRVRPVQASPLLLEGEPAEDRADRPFMTRPDLLVLDEPTSGLDPLMEREFRHCVADARQRGQTVFLSSHILSEVEAVCDRVGILRAGHLVEVGTLPQLRHLSVRTLEVAFGGAGPPPDLAAIPGVSDVSV